jgi:hypothetical protein
LELHPFNVAAPVFNRAATAPLIAAGVPLMPILSRSPVIIPAVTAPELIADVIWVISEWLKVPTKPNHVNRIVAIHPPFLRNHAVLIY